MAIGAKSRVYQLFLKCNDTELSLFLLLLSLTSWVAVGSTSANAGGVVCISAVERGECSLTQPPRASCSASNNVDCRTSNYAGDPASFYNPRYTEHPLDRECVSFPSSTSLPTHSVAQDLTIILYPVGRDKKYSLYVSWQMNEDDGNIEGFFIWNYRCIGPCPFQNDTNSLTSTSLPFYDREKYECLPIHNANVRSVLFDGAQHRSDMLQCKDGTLFTPPRCNSPALMTVMVVPQPRLRTLTLSSLLATSSLTMAWENLDTCWPTAYMASCPSPVFIRPVEDFNVTTTVLHSDGGRFMNIHVEWPCTPGDVEYIVTVTDVQIATVPNCTSPGLNPACFVARDTTEVIITMLNVNKEYSVSVQLAPKCNGSSFAEHYVGCRSEECCQAKRVSHMTSGNDIDTVSTSVVMGVESSRVGMESSCVSIESSRVKIESSCVKIESSIVTKTTLTRYSTIAYTPTSTILGTTPQDQSTEGHRSRSAVIGGVTVAVMIIITFKAIVICYLVRRKFRDHTSSASNSARSASSSLTDSLEMSMEGGTLSDGGCHMFTIDHVGEASSYAVTSSGASVDAPYVGGGSIIVSKSLTHPYTALNSPTQSEGQESQITFEVSSSIGLSREEESTCSESLKISSGGSSTLEDDAFEKASNKSNESKESGTCKQNDDIIEGCRVNEMVMERRSRSESVRVKTNPTGSSSFSRKRPRSFSTPHHVSHPPPSPHPAGSALILYSKGSPILEQRVIQQQLVNDLTLYNIQTVSEDTCTPRQCPASWLETQMREVSAVFCVCNEAFDADWENRTDGLSGLVPVFKQLCHGLVTPSCGKNQFLRDKIAIVLPLESDLQYVPTYLNSRPKFRLLEQDLAKMARFVTDIPQYKI